MPLRQTSQAKLRRARGDLYAQSRSQLPLQETAHMKVWIDQDLCTGDGLCEEIAPDVFTLLDDGLAYVKEGDKVYATAKGNPQGADGMANIPDNKLDAVIESAEECPDECIFIEPGRAKPAEEAACGPLLARLPQRSWGLRPSETAPSTVGFMPVPRPSRSDPS